MKYFGLTNKGKMRKSNQDRYTVLCTADNSVLLAAVCDGMGGASGGEVASSIATSVTESSFKAFCDLSPKQSQWKNILTEIVSDANNSIYETSVKNPSLLGMGTTFVGFIANDKKLTAANVGDSRAYIINEDGITQLTKDHSLVSEMVEKGRISAAEATVHPSKNVITRALGVDVSVECDIYTADVTDGDYILLCSDGLTEEVSAPEIHFEVCNSDSLENAAKSLVDIANARGGHDNITVVICAF